MTHPSALQVILDELREFRREVRDQNASLSKRVTDLETFKNNYTTERRTIVWALSAGWGFVVVVLGWMGFKLG